MGVSFYGELQSMDAHQDIQENMTHELAHESYLGRIGSVTCPGTSPFKLNTLNRYFTKLVLSVWSTGYERRESGMRSRREEPSFPTLLGISLFCVQCRRTVPLPRPHLRLVFFWDSIYGREPRSASLPAQRVIHLTM